jgi:tRNA(His) guanylyltransferase
MHYFEKPNDLNGIGLMNKAALEVAKNIKEIILAYGQSDEYR